MCVRMNCQAKMQDSPAVLRIGLCWEGRLTCEVEHMNGRDGYLLRHGQNGAAHVGNSGCERKDRSAAKVPQPKASAGSDAGFMMPRAGTLARPSTVRRSGVPTRDNMKLTPAQDVPRPAATLPAMMHCPCGQYAVLGPPRFRSPLAAQSCCATLHVYRCIAERPRCTGRRQT